MSSRTHLDLICKYQYLKKEGPNISRSQYYYCYMSGAGSGGQENHGRGSGYLEVAPMDTKRWPPPHVWCGTLLRVALSSIPYAFRVTGTKRMRCGYLEVASIDIKRWPQPRVCCGTWLCVTLNSTRQYMVEDRTQPKTMGRSTGHVQNVHMEKQA